MNTIKTWLRFGPDTTVIDRYFWPVVCGIIGYLLGQVVAWTQRSGVRI